MDPVKAIVKRSVVWLAIGLVGGGVAVDWWERQRAASEIAELRIKHADKLHEAESKVQQLLEQVKAERQRGEALEAVVADLRKGS